MYTLIIHLYLTNNSGRINVDDTTVPFLFSALGRCAEPSHTQSGSLVRCVTYPGYTGGEQKIYGQRVSLLFIIKVSNSRRELVSK